MPMGKHRLTLKELRKILRCFGVAEDSSRGKGSHTVFSRTFDDGTFSYPIPDRKDVLPCYVKGVRKKLRLLPEHGVTDEEFFGKG